MPPTKEQVLDALRKCQEPELHQDIVTLDMVRDIQIEGGRVSFEYVLTTPACPLKGMMELEAKEAVLRVPGVTDVRVRMTAAVRGDARLERVAPPGVKSVIAVGSGKGGVGKSTVACNLAVSLALDGAKVGLMDADVYGPNQPQMMGVGDFQPTLGRDDKMFPAEAFGVKVFSMGFLMEPDQPVIWRGPMLHSAVTQFLRDVRWGEIDYLIVDLPPGTGDVQLSLCQSVPLVGAVIVTTPQSIALSDVRKAVAMFQKMDVPILGVVENMGEFACPHCGKTSEIFSRGGADALAKLHGVPLLGKIPLDPSVCATGENGKPAVVSAPDGAPAKAFRAVARQVAAAVSIRLSQQKPLETQTVK